MTSVAGTTHPQDCKLDEATYNGWSVFRLSNGLLKLYLAAQLGGRAIRVMNCQICNIGTFVIFVVATTSK